MAITQTRTITVFVSDQDRAKAFYTDLLGFEARDDQTMGNNRWLEVVPRHGGSGIVLHRPFPGTTPGTNQGVILESDDLDGDCAALTRAGVAVDGPQDMPWGRQATFADPDGNGYVLAAR